MEKLVRILLTLLLLTTPSHMLNARDAGSHREWRYARNLMWYTHANIKKHQGKGARARELYNKVIQNGGSVFAYDGLLRLHEQTGNHHAIAALSQPLSTHFEDSPDILLLFAQATRKVGRIDEGNERIVELSKKFADHQDIVLSAIEAHLYMEKPDDALAAIDSLLDATSRTANRPLLLFLKAQIHAQAQDYEKALTALDDALERNPRFVRASLMRALVLDQQKKISRLKRSDAVSIDVAPKAEKALSRHLLDMAHEKLLAQYICPVDSSLQQRDAHAVLRLLEAGRMREASQRLDTALKKQPGDTKLRLLKLQALLADKKENKAIETIASWLTQEPYAEIWYKALQLIVRAGASHTRATKVLEQLARKQPENILVPIYLANLFLSTDQQKRAVLPLNDALALCTDRALEEKIIFQLSRLHYEQEAIDKLNTLIPRAEKDTIHFAPLANLVAYYHATETHDLKKAERYVETALNNSPTNDHYRDTKAVLLSAQGDHEAARDILEEISNTHPWDATMQIHLAMVHRALNSPEESELSARKASGNAITPWEHTQANKLLQKSGANEKK